MSSRLWPRTADAEIVKVEISADAGKTWSDASLGKEKARNCWQLWEWNWQVPSKAGRCILLARATDSRGRTQPLERDLNRGTYEINHCLPIEVEIR